VTLSPMRVAAVRHVGPYNEISTAFDKLAEIAGPSGLFAAPGTKVLALYHDDPSAVPPAQLRSDAGLTVPDAASIPAGLTEQRVEGGRFTKAVHVGPYEELPAAWASAKRDFVAAGLRHKPGPSFEIYPNSPMDTPKDKLITEIYMPVL
jgi:AraC family transcriptional regulator